MARCLSVCLSVRHTSVLCEMSEHTLKHFAPSSRHTILVFPYAVSQSTLDEDCRQAEEPKQLVDEVSRFHLGRQRQHSAVICSDALLFSSRVLRPSLVTLCSHKSGRCACVSSLVPSVLHLSHGFQCSPTLNRQPYERRLPLTNWWRKSSNMTVGQSSLISLAHHCYD